MLAKDRVFAIRAGAYTSSDIKEASFNYGYISGDTFKPGGTVAGSAKLTFTSIITSFNKLDKVYPEIGLKVGDSFEWVAMGEYFVNDINIDRNRNTTELDLIDGMFKLNQPYISDLTYPAQIRDVIREICAKTGVELETDNLGFRAIQHHIQSKADKKDITFREVLSQAIQLLGFSAFFNRKGKLEIRGLIESNITITADNYFLHGLTKSELMYQIAGITCKKDKETLTVGLRTGRSLELENNFMIQNILDDLYYDLKNIRYYPYSLEWQGHLKLDVGQWVTLKTNKNETFKVPVLSQSFNFKGGLKSNIGADSKAGNDTQYAYKGFLGKRIEQMSTEIEAEVQQQLEYKDKEFDEKINKVKSEINDGIEQSKAEAERYADQIKTEISQEFDAFEQEYQVTKQSQSQQIADILAKAQANTILATDAKNIGNQAKADAANALSKAIQYKNEAIAEATRLDTVERQATETKLATAKSQAISEATRLVETAKSLLSGQISNISTDLSQTKEAIKLLATKATVDTLTGRVSSAEAMIQVQADQISQRVKTSDFDQAKQRISTAESSIIQIGNRITTEISETVAKIPTEIGGRNYFRGYKYNEEITLNSYQNVGSFTQFYNRLTYNLPESDGKTFTISFEAISPNGETPLEVYNRNQDPQYFNFPSRRIGTVGPTWQKFTRTVTVATQTVSNTTNSNRIEIYAPNKTGVRVRNIKVELGNIATDWSPAPEDVVTEIENVKTIITQTAEGQQQLSTRLTEIQGKVMTTETSIEQLVGDVSSKVSQTTFDNLKRTVDSQATSISQNQSDIALKAEKTYVDGVKATADSAKSTASDALTKANANADSIKTTQAELKVTSDAVKTKVTRTDFDKVDGRLRTAESTIVTQAGEIEKRLTSTQVETAISNKGYQTKADVDKNITDRGFATSTTVQNIVKETSEIFNRSISRVESSIPTDYDNQNLWIKSKSSGYSAIEKLPDNHISGQSECYRLNNGTQLIFNIEPEFSSRLYQKVTFSAWVKYNNVVRGSNAWNVFNCFKHVIYRKNSKTGVESSVAYTTPVAFEGTSDWKYISFTIDYSTQSQYDQLKTSLAFRMENAASGTAWVTGVKVELGSKATRYNLAVEDTVTVTSFNSVSDTVSSHTQTLSEQGKSISQVIQTAQGLVTRIDNLSVGGRNLFKGYKYNEEITLNNYQGVGSFTQFYNRLTYNLPDAGGKEFTISFEAISPNGDTPINVYNDNGAPQYFRFPGQILGTAGATWQKFTRTVTVATQTVSNTTNSNRIEIYAPNKTGVRVRNIKVELGNIATDWSPAPEDNDSAVQAVSTQVNTLAGSWSVQNLNSSGDILSQANLSSAQFFLEAAKIRLKGKTLADEIQAIDGKFGTLFVADGTFAKLNATVIGSQAITADKLKVDQAFFDKLMANDAYLRQLFAKSVFTTQVQAVAVSAKQIVGGIAEALNGGMDVNFDESKINFYTNVAAIRRIYTGHPTQFIKFETEGNYSRTIIGSNRNGGEVFNSATFAGIVVENTNNINTEDNVRIYGDNTLLRHAQGDVGWNINSVTQRIVPANMNAESEIWSKHFVAPDKNSKPVRLDTAVAALWDIWNHIIYNNFEFNAALRTHIKARRDNWKFELNL
ncbi:hypothetical protein RFK98_01740 [Streptococcus suis]|uniref:hypothetical protein n=1 Tax=Streptococcus suis TaxID=1307 RepID=UPI002FCB1030